MCPLQGDQSGIVLMCGGSIALLVSVFLLMIAMKMYGKSSPLKRALALRVLQEAGYDVVETMPASSERIAEHANQAEICWAIKTLLGSAPILVLNGQLQLAKHQILKKVEL